MVRAGRGGVCLAIIDNIEGVWGGRHLIQDVSGGFLEERTCWIKPGRGEGNSSQRAGRRALLAEETAQAKALG